MKESMRTHVMLTLFVFTRATYPDVYLFLDYSLNAMDEPIVQKKPYLNVWKASPIWSEMNDLLIKLHFQKRP